jgi:hypothetical protein
MARKSFSRTRRVAKPAPTDLVGDLNRQVRRDRGGSDRDDFPDPGALVIVRTYSPARDLEQRLSRIYAMLSLPTTDVRGDHDTE